VQPSTLNDLLGHLRRLTAPTGAKELSDADLLENFRSRREEAAFTLLVQRHGPMVHGICRRVLGDAHEAEDAFQATFLVLVRNSAAVRKQQSLPSFLYGVACRIARKARAQSLRRRRRERAVPVPCVMAGPLDPLLAGELRATLDEEIAQLPPKYRMPLVLCYLAEKTHEQAAGELGWPKTSLTSRLARARQLLQRRLLRRGFTASAGLLAVLLTESSVNAMPPAVLTLSTVRLAVQALNGEAIAVTAAAALADTVLKGAALPKWTAALMVLATLGFAAAIGHQLSAIGSPSGHQQSATKALAADDRREPKADARKPRVDRLGDPLPDGVLTRIGSQRMRHFCRYHPRPLAFTPDGKSIISGGPGSLRIWDAATGKLRRRITFETGMDPCPDIVSRADGLVVAVVEQEKRSAAVRVLDPTSGEVRRSVELSPAVFAMPVFSRDGKRLAYGHEKNFVAICDARTGRESLRIPMRGNWVSHMTFAPNGKSIAIVEHPNAVHLHDTANGKKQREFKRDGDTISHLAFSPDGRFLASAHSAQKEEDAGHISLWEAATGEERHRLTGPDGSFIFCIAFSPDSKYLAMGCQNHALVLWDVATGKEFRRYQPEGYYGDIAFSPDGKTLAATAEAGTIHLWDTATGRMLPGSADPFLREVGDLRFSADGRRLIGNTSRYVAWNANTGQEVRRFLKVPLLDVPHRYFNAPLSPDESLLADANREGTIRLREATTGREVRALKGHEKWVGYAIFSPDGRRLVSTGGDDTIRVWDVANGRQLHKFSGGGAHARSLAFSPDNRWLASATDTLDTSRGQIILWDLTTGQKKSRFAFMRSKLVYQMAFSPDSRLLAAVGGLAENSPGEIKVWNVAAGKEWRSLDGPKTTLLRVAFSPDGRVLATGAGDGALDLWELASGRKRHSFIGHETMIVSLAFSPDNRLLAASSFDAPLYVWDVAGTIEQPRRPLSDAELRRCWIALADDDATAAFQAIRRLTADPERTLPYLREHLKPVPAPDLKRLRQLVKTLDSDEFKERQKAAEELKKVADAAASTLRQMANEKSSLYVRRTLQQILDAQETTPEALRAVRAVEVLEWIATSDAARLLDELAKGAPDARLTREAAAAHTRLRRAARGRPAASAASSGDHGYPERWR
jgi:RNA polymerase sigma factor (sigma-70 family)